MAIPQGQLSSEVVEGTFIDPEGRLFLAQTSYEKGPITLEDTSEGLLYQNWRMYWDTGTFKLLLLGETTSELVEVATIPGLVSATFSFDQSGRLAYTYTDATSSYISWYDTAQGQVVLTDLGADAITPAITLDDKRVAQSTQNDMLLWYTKANGDTYDLIMCRQRDRFLTEYVMASGLEHKYLHNIGMTDELRIQMILKPVPPPIPYGG